VQEFPALKSPPKAPFFLFCYAVQEIPALKSPLLGLINLKKLRTEIIILLFFLIFILVAFVVRLGLAVNIRYWASCICANIKLP
jgi:hypothetical protein